MVLEIIIPSEVSQRQTYDITYMESKKRRKLNYWPNRLTAIAIKLTVTKGEGVGRDKLGVWDELMHTTIYKIKTRSSCLAQGTTCNIL